MISYDIHERRGAAIIRGFKPANLSLVDNVIAFAGLASYIGDQRGSQSSKNDVLSKILPPRDIPITTRTRLPLILTAHLHPGNSKAVSDPRPGLSNHGLVCFFLPQCFEAAPIIITIQPFHTDHCDILALYALETAISGGDTFWASTARIYNEMVRTKPQVISVLAKDDWPHETYMMSIMPKTTQADAESRAIKTTKYLPLMFIDDQNQPFLNFTRFALTGLPTYPKSSHIPDMSDEQADALDTIEYLASANAVHVQQQDGDMLFLNNRGALHARGKILDDPQVAKRHLLRLCLRDSEYGRSIPAALKKRWGDIFDNDQHKTGNWVLTKTHDAAFISSKQFDALFQDETSVNSHN
jgi:hypothetical protein